MAGSDQLLQQRAWPVFGIGELVMEDLHYREQHVEPDATYRSFPVPATRERLGIFAETPPVAFLT